MCKYDVGDDGKLCRSIKRTARKRHRCYECRAEIFVGDEYREDTGLWDGEWSRFKMCGVCAEKAAYLLIECNGFLYGMVCQDYDDHMAEEA